MAFARHLGGRRVRWYGEPLANVPCTQVHGGRVGRLALIMTFALLAVACGGSDDSSETEGVASIRSGDALEDGEGRIGFEEGLLQFTACMRGLGIDLPDIHVDADGQPILSTDVLEGIDTQSSEFNTAFLSCVPILAESAPVQIGSDPELQAVVQDTLRDFSQCMRQNGVEAFPDPAPGYDGSGSPYPLTALDTGDDDVDAAFEECSSLLSFPGVG